MNWFQAYAGEQCRIGALQQKRSTLGHDLVIQAVPGPVP
jgi:hypothetical protein